MPATADANEPKQPKAVTEKAEPRLLLNEVDRIIDWRETTLENAGYGADSIGLARNFEIDLHGAVELVERGCPVETAVKILT